MVMGKEEDLGIGELGKVGKDFEDGLGAGVVEVDQQVVENDGHGGVLQAFFEPGQAEGQEHLVLGAVAHFVGFDEFMGVVVGTNADEVPLQFGIQLGVESGVRSESEFMKKFTGPFQ